MLNNFQRWFAALPFSDPVRRRQALVIQAIILIVIGAGVIGLFSGQTLDVGARAIQAIIYLVLLVVAGSALWVLRIGRFSTSVALLIASLLAPIGFSLISFGMEHSESIVLAFTIPIVIASLTLGRRWLIGTTSLAVACIVITAVGESLHVSWVKFFPLSSMQPFSWAVSVLLVLGVLVVLLDRFWDTLRGALMDATTRQQALELLQSSLEHTVAERTDSLAAALREVEQREARLTETIHELRASEALVREMRTPVIPVLAGVLVVPLVGALDELRTSDMSQQVLEQVERQRAQQVIFDVTGVPLVDTYVAGMLLRTAASIRLLGAQALLVGVRPEVAQTIVSLGSDLSSLPTYADLREAVEALILNSRSLGA